MKFKKELEIHCHTSQFVEIHWSFVAAYSSSPRGLSCTSFSWSFSYPFYASHLLQAFFVSLLCPQYPQSLSLYFAEVHFCLCHGLTIQPMPRELCFLSINPLKYIKVFVFYEVISPVALIFFFLLTHLYAHCVCIVYLYSQSILKIYIHFMNFICDFLFVKILEKQVNFLLSGISQKCLMTECYCSNL